MTESSQTSLAGKVALVTGGARAGCRTASPSASGGSFLDRNRTNAR